MGRIGEDEIRPPEIRIAEEVRDGHLHAGELIHAQIKMKHPNRTGLAFRNGGFVRESVPFHLQELEVLYGGERVCRFELTAALSDDPFITFALLARGEGPLVVRIANNRGQRFEASRDVRFA